MHSFYTVLDGLPKDTLDFAGYIIEAMAHRVVDDTDMVAESGDPLEVEAVAATRRLMTELGVTFENHYTVDARKVVIRNDSDTGCTQEAAHVIQVLLNQAKDDRWVPIEYGVLDDNLLRSVGALVVTRKFIAKMNGSLLIEQMKHTLACIV